jgi:cation/acetate symporter
MLLNFAVALTVSHLSEEPPESVQKLVDNIRIPSAGKATRDY